MTVFRTLQGRLRFFVTLLFGAPLLLAPLVFLFFLRSPFLDVITRDMHAELEHHREFIEGWMEAHLGVMQLLAGTVRLRDSETDDIGELFKVARGAAPDFTDILLFDVDGEVRRALQSSTGFSIADRTYFRVVLEGRAFVSEVIQSRVSGRPIVVFAVPVRDEHKHVEAGIGGIVDLSRINSTLQSLRLKDGGSAFIVGSGGECLTDGSRLAAGEVAELRALAAAQHDGYVVVRNAAGDSVVRVALTLKDGEWLLVRELPLDVALASQRQAAFVVLLVNSGIVLLLAPLVLRFGRSILHPVAVMTDLSGRMADGVYQRECGYVDLDEAPEEIRRLYDNFCVMSVKLYEHLDELERLAVTDLLTGLHNRRYMVVEGAKTVDVCRRGGKPCCCMMADIDHFKRINDTYGHDAGDTVLRAFAKVLRDTLRWSDVGARYGGEEFAIIAPNATPEDGVRLAERLRKAVAGLRVEYGGQHAIRFTVSVGVAALGSEHRYGETMLEDLLGKADAALYRAKADGRDRVCLWWDGSVVPAGGMEGAPPRDGAGGPSGTMDAVGGAATDMPPDDGPPGDSRD